jgi:hypothetical protein
MKTKSWITLCLLMGIGISLILLQSCEKLKEATTFKIKYDLPDSHFSIDSTSLSHLKTEMVLYSQTNSAINIDSIAGTHTGLIDRASFYKLKFSIVSPETAEINWLTSARVTVTPQDGLPIEIATSPIINSTDRTIDFVVKDVDMLATVKKPFIITLLGDLNEDTPTLPMETILQSGIVITISPL